jgi:predicted PurR-regulated permease PerM
LDYSGFSSGARILIILASFVIVVAGIKSADAILVTFLLSGFFAIICAPPFIFMQNRGMPAWLSLLVIVFFISVIQLLFFTLVASSVADFSQALPSYQLRLQGLFTHFVTYLASWGINLPAGALREHFNPALVLKLSANALGGLGGVLSNSFMIILTVIFMLFEGMTLPSKLEKAFGSDSPHIPQFKRFVGTVKQYMTIKTLVSLLTGGIVYIWLIVLGVDYALLWGVLAFLLNFVPNIGSIIAAVPAVLMALIQLGPWTALFVASGYLVVNTLVGNVIEPRFMGKGLGLSTLVVFLSLVFWGWLLGPVGMLLSVPLTMLMKIALESSEDTRWLAILMGSDKN